MGVFIYDVAPLAANETARERAVEQSGALALAGNPALQVIADEAARRHRTECATISIIFRGWQYLLAAHGLPGGVTRRSSAFCAHAILRPQRIFLVLDAAHDVRFAENPNVTAGPGIRFYAGATLSHDRDVALGTLCVFDPRPRTGFAPHDEQALRAAAAETLRTIQALGPGIERASALGDAV